MQPRIGILGAGSIGRYMAGQLILSGADVVLVGRERQRDALAAHGITVVEPETAPRSVRGDAVDFHASPVALLNCDVVLVCTKSAQTADTARELGLVLAPGAVVVSLQNGVRNAPTLSRLLPDATVVPAIVSFNVVSGDDGLVSRGTSGPLMLGATGFAHRPIEEALRDAGVEVEVHDDLLPHQWTKLVVNLSNAVSALSGAPTVELLASAGYRRIIAALTDEALAVLWAARIAPATLWGLPLHWMPRILRLPTPLVRLVLRKRLKVDPTARSSMWEDLQRRKLTEVDYLNGEIVAVADRVGAAAPLHRRVVALVHEAEAAGAGSPGLEADALWAALQDQPAV